MKGSADCNGGMSARAGIAVVNQPLTSRTAEGVPTGMDQNPRRIREMFAQITPSYDRLNHLLSASLDRRWRGILAEELVDGLRPCRRILDVATGTGDLAKAVAERAGKRAEESAGNKAGKRAGKRAGSAGVVGVDFTREMLTRASKKYGTEAFQWIEGDGLVLPFAAGSFDAVCIAFGLRNMANRPAGLAEMRRVTRPGGRVAILEFSQPRNPIAARLYGFYSFSVMPRVGKWLSGSNAYLYLPHSIKSFMTPEELKAAMEEAGLINVRARGLAAGIVHLHMGEVPEVETNASGASGGTGADDGTREKSA